jgi:hypothetical protein
LFGIVVAPAYVSIDRPPTLPTSALQETKLQLDVDLKDGKDTSTLEL